MYTLLTYISFYSIFPIAIWTFIKRNTFKLQHIKLLAYFVMYTAIHEIIIYIWYKFALDYNFQISSLLASIELILIVLYYSAQIQFNKLRIPYLILAALSILFMGYTLFDEPNQYPNIPIVSQSILIICLSLYHAYRWFTFPSAKPYELFVILAFLCYYILTLTFFVYALSIPKEWWPFFGMIKNISNIVCAFLLSLALFQYEKYYSIRTN